jgi:hypothetical protein
LHEAGFVIGGYWPAALLRVRGKRAAKQNSAQRGKAWDSLVCFHGF